MHCYYFIFYYLSITGCPLQIWSQNLWLCYAVSMGKCILKTPKCNDTSYMGISQCHHRFCDESNISSQILWNFTESVMALCYSHVWNLTKFYYEHTITISQNLWKFSQKSFSQRGIFTSKFISILSIPFKYKIVKENTESSSIFLIKKFEISDTQIFYT